MAGTNSNFALYPSLKQGGTIILTGERGSGKTELAKGLVKFGEQSGFEVFSVQYQQEARVIGKEHQNDWEVWKCILQQIVQSGSKKFCMSPAEWVLNALRGSENEKEYVGID